MANVHFRYINYLRRTRKRHFISEAIIVANMSIIVGYGQG